MMHENKGKIIQANTRINELELTASEVDKLRSFHDNGFKQPSVSLISYKLPPATAKKLTNTWYRV